MKIDKNKKVLIGVLAAILIVVLLAMPGCPKQKTIHGNKFEVETTKLIDDGETPVAEIYVDLDPSGSWKGFTEFKGFPDARQNFIYNITTSVDKISKQYDSKKVEIKCGDLSMNTIKALIEKLNGSNSLFEKATTDLGNMIENSLLHVSDTSISILVSDMVLSHGKKKLKARGDNYYNKHDLNDGLAAKISNSLSNHGGVDILLIQYYSDFNGKYYYNYTENLENENRYRDSLMLNRPYYLMVFGPKAMLENLLKNNVFPQWEHIYASFGLDQSDMIKSKFTPSRDESSSWICDNSTEPGADTVIGTIWTKAQLGTQQDVIHLKFDKFDIPSFLNPNYEIGDYHLSEVIDDVRDVTLPSNPNVLCFDVTLKPYDDLPEEGMAEFTLVSKNNWIDEATVPNDDDCNITSLSELEGKTWGIGTVVRTINDVYFGTKEPRTEVIAKLKFKVAKQ